MATIDLAEAARRARACGKSAEEFVRACFEGDPGVCSTPSPAGPIPIPYPNLPGTKRLGGLPDLQRGPGSPTSPVGTLDPPPGIDAAILAFYRAVVAGSPGDRGLSQALRDRLGGSGEQARMQVREAAGKAENLQEAALTALLLGLLNAYSMAVQPALETVLRQAQQSLGWQRGAVGPGQQPIVRFLLQLAQAAMQVFRMTAPAIAPFLFAVAIVLALGPVAVLVVILIFSFGGASSGRTSFSLAPLPAGSSAVAAALAAAFAAGVSVDAIVRTGIDFGARSAREWAESVCEGWRRSPGRAALGDLVRSLRGVLGLSLSVMASVFRYTLEKDASTIAHAFRSAGCAAQDVAAALHDAGFSAADAARALRDAFQLSSDQLSLALQQAQFDQAEVASAVSSLFSKGHDVLGSIAGRLR